MPPRKRRQSAQGEEIGKECNERLNSVVGTSADYEKNNKVCAIKVTEGTNPPERRLTARQQSRQDARLEIVAAAEKQKEVVVASTSAEPAAKLPTRFSTRVVKRPRRDLSPPESPVKKGKKTPAPAVTSTPETKGKRPWELWSVEDKDSFFEGLCEYGKDFESIHNLIVAKCRKKGAVLPITVKNKEQVRHFYYRTWHKISKLIQPVQDLKKDIQELYGLISYSVLRKKIRGGVNPNDKNWQKLNELVHQGNATIKVKGKRIRVKTPVCNALKKLNSYEDSKREPGPRVPDKIRVEFRPKTNSAWKQVQDLSQNPRLRVTVKPDRHLQSVIKFLDQKWKSHRLKIKDSMNETEVSRQEFRVYPHHDSVVKCINLEAIDEPILQFSLNKHNKDAVHTSPSSGKRKKEKDGCTGNKNAIGHTATETCGDASKSVINDFKCCACKETCKLCSCHKDAKSCGSKDFFKSFGCKDSSKPCSCKCGKESGVNVNKDTVNRLSKSGTCDVFSKSGSECEITTRSLFSAVSESEGIACSEMTKKSNVVPNSMESHEQETCLPSARTFSVPDLSAIVAGENAMFPDLLPVQNYKEADVSVAVSTSAGDVKVEEESCSKDKASKEVESEIGGERHDDTNTHTSGNSSQSEMERICRDIMNQGWTLGDEENVTLAELYLMFGQNGELRFEYEWVTVKTDAELLHESLLLNLNNMLRRLSHLATVEFTDFTKAPSAGTTCQLCGQVQGCKQRGKGKEKSPAGKSKAGRSGKDASTQTQGQIINKKDIPVPISPAPPTSTNCNGVFRVPVVTPNLGHQHRPISGLSNKEFVQRMNPTAIKPLMRPRKLKPVSRSRTTAPGGTIIGQRTILPKNHPQLVTFYPVVANAHLPGQQMDKNMMSQTIVGHPINGIQTQLVSMTTTSLPCTVSAKSNGSPLDESMNTTITSSCGSVGVVEMSLSPDGDQTLMRIPASHIGSMSPEALKAAGLSAVAPTPMSTPLSVTTTPVPVCKLSDNPVSTSTPMVSSKCSISPPNLSSLLDMSLSNMGTGSDTSKFMDLETDTTFSSLLGDNSKSLSLLTTPPIRSTSDQPHSSLLHSPPVRSLFRTSPTPDSQWLNGDVHDLSLTSFLESPSKPSSINFSQNNSILPLNLFSECSRDSQSNKIDVDSTLHCMMNESSIDYVKKFADLAEQIAQSERALSQSRKTETQHSHQIVHVETSKP